MKNLIFKLIFVPFSAYFASMITVAILGSFMGTSQLKDLIGGTNVMPIWQAWIGMLLLTIIGKHIANRIKK